MIYNILKKNSFYLVHLPFILYSIILTVLLILPSQKLPEVFEVSDKIKHFFAFLVFTFLFSASLHFKNNFTYKLRNIFFTTGISSIIYGGITEIIQTYVPGRSGDLYDLTLNILGSLTGMYLFFLFLKFSKLNLKKIGTK